MNLSKSMQKLSSGLRLHGELTDALQDGVHLVVGTFCGLDEARSVHRVALCLSPYRLIWLRIFSRWTRPAASSAALLMRRPDDSFCMLFDRFICVAERCDGRRRPRRSCFTKDIFPP